MQILYPWKFSCASMQSPLAEEDDFIIQLLTDPLALPDAELETSLWSFKGHPPIAGLSYGEEDSISPGTLVLASMKG